MIDPAANPAHESRGAPSSARRDEHDRLRAAGARDLAWGRLYEGHVNALQLIERLGDERQRARARADAAGDLLFGVWNTEAADGVRVVATGGDGVVLAGRKTFCSGAGRVQRALVTAALPDGSAQLAVIPMDRVAVTIDRTFWQPYGMEDSDSFAVDFTGVRLARADLLGSPGDYERAPWFTAGASRFVAVQTGGVEQLVADFGSFLRRRGQHEDAVQLTRFGECAVDARTARLWTDACADA